MKAENRLLHLFRLTVPPVFYLLLCYTLLGEHVFGLAYIVGKRTKPRMLATLRVFYYVGMSVTALSVHLLLMYACGGTQSACPRVRLGERNCVAITSASAIYCGVVLVLERWANPMLRLGQPTGLRVRAQAAAGMMVTWMAIGDEQLGALLLLLLFTARRAFERAPTLSCIYGYCIKTYAAIYMFLVLTRECEGASNMAAAMATAMAAL